MRKEVIVSIITYLALVLAFSQAAVAQEHPRVAEFLFETGKEYYEQGDYEQALHELGKALLADPDHVKALKYIQIIEKELGLLEKDIDGLQISVEEIGQVKAREEAMEEALREAEAETVVEQLPLAPEVSALEEVVEEPEEEMVEAVIKELEEIEESIEEEKVRFGPFEKFDGFIEDVNEQIAPAKISGEYTVGLGGREGDLIWKQAHGDYNETNWRRIHKDFGVNTYDTRVFDRLRLNLDTEKEEGFNFHSNITIDPWSFIGKSDAVNISSPAGERANVQLKYWSANSSIINETVLSLNKGGAIGIPETKVVDGKVSSMVVTNTWSESLTIPELEIDEELWPIRELWVDYNNGDEFQFRFFPIAYQDQALKSDDPLGLSHHMIYWEESPWLDRWQPGILNVGTAPVDFSKGEWEDDLSFFTRDSNMTRLTSLRGFSLKTQPLENVSIESAVASPKGLWQDYDQVDNIEGATRIKFTPEDELELGLVHTFRYGLEDSDKDAENRVIGADFSYNLACDLRVKGEVAYSQDEQDLTQEPYNTEKEGNAYKFELKRGKVQGERPEKWDEQALEELEEVEPFDWALRLGWTHMDKGFYPALATYRITRKDPFWGRHMHFKRPLKYYYGGLYYPTLTWYDIRAQRIGDSVDIDRDVASLRLEKAFLGGDMEVLFDCRNAHEASSGKYIETVGRLETDWQVNERLLVKLLGIYHDLPETTGGVDPFIYDVDTDEFFLNSWIEDGEDPTLKTASCGFKYDFFDGLSFDFIYEYTNDVTVALDDYPRSLLNTGDFAAYTQDGLVWRKPTTSLYDQFLFPTPPYPWFGIYKAAVELAPSDDLKLRLDFTKNDYKFAGQIDDNINHWGLEADYNITEELSLKLNYTYSKFYSVQLRGEGLDYQGHHSVFVNLDYEMEDKGVFSLQFGEAALLPYSTMFATSPYGGFLPTVDTAHIVRAYFSRKF